MGDLLVSTELLGSRCGIATTDHGDCASCGSFDDSVSHSLGCLFESFEFEHACRTVPDDGLGGLDGINKKLGGFCTNVEAHPASRDAFLVAHGLGSGSGVELIGSDVVDREDDFLAGGLGLGNEFRNELCAFFVEQGGTDFDIVENLLEGERHATADNNLVGLVEEVVDELDLVSDLCTAEDGEERTRRIVQNLVEGLEFLVHEEASGALRKFNTCHGGVGTVSGTESVVDVNVGELGEACTEGLDGFLVGLDLFFGAVGVLDLALAFFFDVEAEVFEKDDVTRLCSGACGFDFGTAAVVKELDRLLDEFFELLCDRSEGELRVHFAVRAAEVGSEDHSSTLVESVLDGREGGFDTLGVGDFTSDLVLRNVEVDTDEHALAGEFEIFDRKLCHYSTFWLELKLRLKSRIFTKKIALSVFFMYFSVEHARLECKMKHSLFAVICFAVATAFAQPGLEDEDGVDAAGTEATEEVAAPAEEAAPEKDEFGEFDDEPSAADETASAAAGAEEECDEEEEDCEEETAEAEDVDVATEVDNTAADERDYAAYDASESGVDRFGIADEVRFWSAIGLAAVSVGSIVMGVLQHMKSNEAKAAYDDLADLEETLLGQISSVCGAENKACQVAMIQKADLTSGGGYTVASLQERMETNKDTQDSYALWRNVWFGVAGATLTAAIVLYVW